MRTRTYLDVRFDVTHLSENERGALAFEVSVQGEESDYVGEDETGHWIGHGEVAPPEIEYNEIEVEDETVWHIGKTGWDEVLTMPNEEAARLVLLGIGIVDPEGIQRGDYYVDPPIEVGQPSVPGREWDRQYGYYTKPGERGDILS